MCVPRLFALQGHTSRAGRLVPKLLQTANHGPHVKCDPT